MCLYPTLIKNRKYTANKKNGGNIPPVSDNRVTMVPVGCGKCMECRKQKARNWQVRMLEDLKKHKNGKFITLTFSNEKLAELAKECQEKTQAKGYDLDNEIATLAIRRFLERWRKEYKKSLRHWFVTELGHEGTEHLHMHGIVWTNEPIEKVKEKWNNGYVWTGKYVNEKTVNYIIKYVHKVDEDHKEYNSKILTSPGIGGNYLESTNVKRNKFKTKETKETYKTRTGHEIAMPAYWRNRIYNDEEREKLWLQKLDEKVRYINGEKVDISKDEKEYYKLLKYARAKNKRLGYGTNEDTWEQKEYEMTRRELKIKERTGENIIIKREAATYEERWKHLEEWDKEKRE